MKATLDMSHLSEWFAVRFDDTAIALQGAPPDAVAWQAVIPWERITRVCFRAGDWWESDAIYLFTDERPGSYAIPADADGGQALWFEILARNLFDAEMAVVAAAGASGEQFCDPPAGQQAGAVPGRDMDLVL